MTRVTKARPHLSEEELRERLKATPDRKTAQKLLVILNATVDPRPAEEIALHTGVSVHSVHCWISAYNRSGLDGMVGPGSGGRRKGHMGKEEEALFLKPFLEAAARGEITTIDQIKEALEERVGKPLHHSVVYRFLHRNGWRKVVPRPSHVKSKKEVQEEFKKEAPGKVKAIIEQRDPQDRRPVALCSQDEGIFGRINPPRACWAPEGVRPKVPRQIVRAYVYVYTAVCMATGKMTSLILPYANTDMMNLFLAQVAQDFKEFFVIMLIDQAGWHMAKKLKVPENIRLLPQPPHSPELNPVEHIWEDLREKAMLNKAFKSLDQVEEALCCRLRQLESDPKMVRSMTDFPYLRIAC
jgi:transposase